MQRLTTAPAFNPFIIYINDKRYEVGGFRFYRADGTTLKTRSGWFGYNNQIREGLEIPDVIKRNKEKFDGQTFALLEKKSYNDKSVAILYIPFEYFDFDVAEHVENRGWYELHYNVYTSRINPKVIVEDRETQWEVTIEKVKIKAVNTYNALVDAIKEVERLEKEAEKLDPYNHLRQEYVKLGLLK